MDTNYVVYEIYYTDYKMIGNKIDAASLDNIKFGCYPKFDEAKNKYNELIKSNNYIHLELVKVSYNLFEEQKEIIDSYYNTKFLSET